MYQRRRSGQVNVSLLFLRKELRELRKNKFIITGLSRVTPDCGDPARTFCSLFTADRRY
jgi:hypothetical protein